MQSSFMNSATDRLPTATHSFTPSLVGVEGARPRGRRLSSATLDKREPSDLRAWLALATAPQQQARDRADAARQDEARAERAGRERGQPRPELGRDVGRAAEARPQVLDGPGELVPLGLDLLLDPLGCPPVNRGHSSS